MPRGNPARKRRSSRRSDSDTAGVGKARSAAVADPNEQDVTELVAATEEALEELETDELAEDMGPCAECEHSYDMHPDGGQCSASGCSCMSYDAGSPDDEVEASGLMLPFEEAFEFVAEGMQPAQRAVLRLRLASFAVETLPVEHTPGESLPAANPSPAAPDTPALDGQVHWVADFVPEGFLTDDFRAMAPDSITWRETPLSLMAMTETSEGGHVGAKLSGRIDRIWRDANASPVMIRASGIFETNEYGKEIAQLVENKSLRGISVDLAILEYEVGPVSDYFDADGNWAPREKEADRPEPTPEELLFADTAEDQEQAVFVVTKAVIGTCTVCPFPAFSNCDIEIAASLSASVQSPAVLTVTSQAAYRTVIRPHECAQEEGGLSASATPVEHEEGAGADAASAPAAPLKPPAEWFQNPELEELTALTIDEDGRVYGHAWSWDVCHTGFPQQCVTAPHSESDYAYFHLGEVLCEDGTKVGVGKVTIGTGHAGRRLSAMDAVEHYDNTGTVSAYVCVGEDEHGGWVAGAVRPDQPAEKVAALRGATLSGDWRKVARPGVPGTLELVALLAVNVPGFPVPRPRALVASGEDVDEVLTLVAAGVHMGIPDREELTLEQAAKLAEIAERVQARREAS